MGRTQELIDSLPPMPETAAQMAQLGKLLTRNWLHCWLNPELGLTKCLCLPNDHFSALYSITLTVFLCSLNQLTSLNIGCLRNSTSARRPPENQQLAEASFYIS